MLIWYITTLKAKMAGKKILEFIFKKIDDARNYF